MSNKRNVVVYGTIAKGVLNCTINKLPFLAKKMSIKSFVIDCSSEDPAISSNVKNCFGLLKCSFINEPLLTFKFIQMDYYITASVGDSFCADGLIFDLKDTSSHQGPQTFSVQTISSGNISTLTTKSIMSLVLEFSD